MRTPKLVRDVLATGRGRRVFSGTCLALASTASMAQTAVDTTDITTAISLYTAAAITVSIAFTVSILSVRSSKLMRRS